MNCRHIDGAEDRLTARQHLMLGGVFLAAAGIRLLYLWGQARHNPLFNHPMMDGQTHHTLAQQIASGVGLGDVPYYRAPLYDYWLGLIYRIFGPTAATGRYAGALLGAVNCYLLARLGVILAGYRVGWVAGILAAVYWPLVYFDGELLSTGLEIFLDLAMLLLLLRGMQRGSWLLLLAGGFAWGLSAITRPTILTFGLGIVTWLWISAPRGRRMGLTLRRGAMICAGALLAILPVTARNVLVGKEWVLIAGNGGINFYIGNNPKADGVSAVVPDIHQPWAGGYEETRRLAENKLGRKLTAGEVSRYWFKQSWKWIQADPLAWGGLMLRKLGLFWSPFERLNNQPIGFFAHYSWVMSILWIGFPVIACLGISSLAFVFHGPVSKSTAPSSHESGSPQTMTRALPAARKRREWFLPAAFIVIYMVTVTAFFCNARYRLPVAAILILFGAVGVTGVVERITARRLKEIGPQLWVLCGCVIFMLGSAWGRGKIISNDEAEGHELLGLYYMSTAMGNTADLEKAASHFREAIAHHQQSPTPRTALGRILVMLDRPKEAKEQFSQAIAEYPDRADTHLNYGVFLSARHRNNKAIEQFRAALALQPGYAEAHLNLGLLFHRMGRKKRAVKQLRAALAIQPNLKVARRLLKSMNKPKRPGKTK